MWYEIPEEYYYRIHHIRPRFKAQVENVLVSMATGISNIGLQENATFREKLNNFIKSYPGNEKLSAKTINNWRTEISSLFGLFIEGDAHTSPGLRSLELAEDQDLRAFFKKFLYSFEYPGGHLKNQEILKLCQQGIFFKPAQYIIEILDLAREINKSEAYLTSAEVTHCIFNDLRVTRDHRPPFETWELIRNNRQTNVSYDSRGDVVRYAGDILDYMVIANLLKINGRRYVLNSSERFIDVFREMDRRFDGYQSFIGKSKVDISDIKNQRVAWFEYVNESFAHLNFNTDISEFLPEIAQVEKENIIMDLQEHIGSSEQLSTSIIGLTGESLVVSLEKQKLHQLGFDSLIHLVNFIPTKLAVGYDVQSFETDGTELRRYIEVKTTVSSRSISFNSIQITENEWRTAKSVKDRYYIYRLVINEYEKRLFVIPNVVGQIQDGKITISKGNNRYDLSFIDSAGYEERII